MRVQTPTSAANISRTILTASTLFPLYPESGVPKSFWRLPCRGQSGIGRVDPLMDPGIPGAHVHTISGGNGFGFNATFESLTHSTCTSCAVKQDKSAYWTPTLNFMYANGTTVMVEQIGGMLVYYKAFKDTIAFPEGFRMVAGNPYIRNFTGPFPDAPQSDPAIWKNTPEEVVEPEQQFFLMQRALGFNCLDFNGQALTAEASLWRHQMPTKDYMDTFCIDGLRLELAFPSCGNGSTDSEDHRSHMAYPSTVQQGVCPKGYNLRYPLLFYETIYNTWAFAGIQGQFVLSYGDPIGTGYHGDFVMGWDSSDLLQHAIDTCRDTSGRVKDCPVFDLQNEEDQQRCHFAVPHALRDDNAIGPRNGLAIDVPIQYGPAQATTYPAAGQSGVPVRHFESAAPPRTLIGNLSIHPYGSLANPTLIPAATRAGTISMLYTPVELSTPTPAGMTPLSPITYVSGVIAAEFSKYLTMSLSDTPTGGDIPSSVSFTSYPGPKLSLPGTPASYQMHSPTVCENNRSPKPISVETSYKTIGNEVVQIFIEDVEFVFTTRTTITVSAGTSTVDSSATTEQTRYLEPGRMSDRSTSNAAGQFTGSQVMFNTIMWVSGSQTLYTSPSTVETANSYTTASE